MTDLATLRRELPSMSIEERTSLLEIVLSATLPGDLADAIGFAYSQKQVMVIRTKLAGGE